MDGEEGHVDLQDTGGGNPVTQPVLEDPLLAVANWWVGRHSRVEVLDLLTRHFLPVDMLMAHQELARVCQMDPPGIHKSSANRPAADAYAIDLYNNLFQLSHEKRLPRLMVCSDNLGKVPLGALSISDERSVSARLERLEESVLKVTSVMEKVCNNMTPNVASVPLPRGLSDTAPAAPQPGHVPAVDQPGHVPPTFPVGGNGQQVFAAQPAPVLVPPKVVVTRAVLGQQGQETTDWAGVAAAGHSLAEALQIGKQRGRGQRGATRDRSISSSTKRKAPGEDDEGFRKQGRPRQTTGGSSKVVIDDLGEYQPYLQYYISNTPGHATDELIKKVLQKCSVPLLEGQPCLEIAKVECLTNPDIVDPRTRCWKVAVPFKYKAVMENAELYPQGWRHRKFFGDRNSKDQKSKHAKMEDPRLREAEQELERDRLAHQQRQEDERAAVLQAQEQVVNDSEVPQVPPSPAGSPARASPETSNENVSGSPKAPGTTNSQCM